MTIIAYRDGVMAADSGAYSHNTFVSFSRKLARGPDGTLYGGMGNAPEIATFLAWVDAGCHGEPPRARQTNYEEGSSSFCILRVRPGHDPELVTAYGVQVYDDAPYIAAGAGQAVALGALHAGATADGAVFAAIEHSDAARGPVRVVRHAFP